MTIVALPTVHAAVNVDHIVDLKVVTQQNHIDVTMIDGRVHHVRCQHGKSVFLTYDDLIETLNKAKST